MPTVDSLLDRNLGSGCSTPGGIDSFLQLECAFTVVVSVGGSLPIPLLMVFFCFFLPSFPPCLQVLDETRPGTGRVCLALLCCTRVPV